MCPEPREEIAVVCDNAPVRAALEQVTEEDEFEGVNILRLAPYSKPLNPIEHIWSAMKAELKREMSATFAEMLQIAPDRCHKLNIGSGTWRVSLTLR